MTSSFRADQETRVDLHLDALLLPYKANQPIVPKLVSYMVYHMPSLLYFMKSLPEIQERGKFLPHILVLAHF